MDNPVLDMTSFITALTNAESGITADNLWGGILPVAGTIAVVTLFAFSYRVLRKLVGGISRGKAKF